MLKKILVILIAVLLFSCDQNNTNNFSANQDELTKRQGVFSTISDTAFSWLLKAGVLFSKKNIFSISYAEGYNINFKISYEEARSLLPSNITPIKIKLIENERTPQYYLSWYLAGMDESSSNSPMQLKRIDLFTYGKDQNNELTMFFVSSYMEMTDELSSNSFNKKMYMAALEYMAMDSQTGEPAYPHYFTKEINADKDSFIVAYENSSIELTPCTALSTGQRFSRDFVLVNSQIYRTAIDKNINYFNQGFMNVAVESRDIGCVSYENLEGFHPFLKAHNLMSIQYYGSESKQVGWYFEM